MLPAASDGLTRSYRVVEDGSLHPTGDVGGDLAHMRAAFHPDGRRVFLTTLSSVAPEHWVIHLRTFAYDGTGCSIGPLLASTEPEGDTASNSRIYGLVAHPNGRWLYQTTGSAGRIRLFVLGPDGVPALRDRYDVTAGGGLVCAETRRLVLGPNGDKLYANCNNEVAGAGVDLALQVWDIGADGALSLAQHLVLDEMDNAIADPVFHPSGRWLYQPVGTGDPGAPEGPGAYVLVLSVRQDGSLYLFDSTPAWTLDHEDSIESWALTKVFPSTFIIHPDGTAAYATVNAMLDAEAFPHELIEYRVEGSGETLREVDRRPVALPMKGSSHHGGALVGVGGSYFLYSYLTDYDTIRGGVLQQFRIGRDHALVPLDPPYVATGLMDARQPIPAR